MAVYNGEKFLREAVDSILNQTLEDFEFIIINDGSTDASEDILDSYRRADPRLQVYSQPNRGLVESLNRGCALARGKYIARMDADDVSIPDRLAMQVEFLEEHAETSVVGGAVEIVDAAGTHKGVDSNPLDDAAIKSKLLSGSSPYYHGTVLMRAEVLAEFGGYRKVVVSAEDYDLWSRMADHYKLANLPATVLKYRRHPQQISVSRCRQQALSWLAARAAAALRKSGNADPLDSATEITPALLVGLGVSESAQQTALASAYVTCLRSMCAAEEYAVALRIVDSLESPSFASAANHVMADFRLATASLYWRRKRYFQSISAAGRALIMRPIIVGRPLKRALRQLRPTKVY
jgi:hypothetical protein